ncbi:HindIII family type II restriction endonuclease [Pantoea sp. B566]|uniref:HindIII family type II restriction endonuclease n=1 Tax=Pantoea sp. B566 TaxID=2974030 RepID=UPI002165A95D|nr:HindIII family type II restriction endonuclease [Pantoea sp. B566]MCS3401129.1 HindIII family type II restriction endonuclease [Pantoea sp. B566]
MDLINFNFINKIAIERRQYWIDEIVKLSGHFVNDSGRVEQEIISEVAASGYQALLDHLRLCTAIPESYSHDSSEEKLYSKYTDALISECFKFMGLNSVVLTERADAADVEVVCDNYSFVADAKVFRLSRTAKNQKDFKVQAMDGWRNTKDFAMVVCPIYQLPVKSSQIYQQAIVRNVCIFTYTHLAVLVRYSTITSKEDIKFLLEKIFRSVILLNPSKDSVQYWSQINRTMLEHDERIPPLWLDERKATTEGILASKKIAIEYLSRERDKILRMSKEEAVNALIKMHKIDSRIDQISKVTENNILSLS